MKRLAKRVIQGVIAGVLIIALTRFYDVRIRPWLEEKKDKGKVIFRELIQKEGVSSILPKLETKRPEECAKRLGSSATLAEALHLGKSKDSLEDSTKKITQGLKVKMKLSLDDVEEIIENLRSVEKNLSGQKMRKGKGASESSRKSIERKIIDSALGEGMDPKLCLAVAKVESNLNPHAISPKGACGVFQLLPSLAIGYGYTRRELFDEDINIRVGIKHLKRLLSQFKGNTDLALAAYHAGVKRVITNGYRIPDIQETKEYVQKVKSLMERGSK